MAIWAVGRGAILALQSKLDKLRDFGALVGGRLPELVGEIEERLESATLQPGVRRVVRLQTGRTRSLSGVVTATWLVLDSAGPPAGPPAPRLSLTDEAVGGAESRPRTGPRGAHRPHEHFTTGEAQELDLDE